MLTAIVHLSIQAAAIFHPASEIVNILTIDSRKKLLMVISTDSVRNRYKVNIEDTIKNG